MKKLHILSAFALFNLFAVTIIAYVSANSTTFSERINSEALPTPNIVVKQVVKKVQMYVTPSPSSDNNINTNQVQNQPTATTLSNNSCIVTIDGVQYDLTDFINLHSGGDIFRCGQDMSVTFWDRHGQSQLNKLQRYRI